MALLPIRDQHDIHRLQEATMLGTQLERDLVETLVTLRMQHIAALVQIRSVSQTMLNDFDVESALHDFAVRSWTFVK